MRRGATGRGGNGGSQGSNWLTTFNDLVTLLMVFFVLLFTISSGGAGKFKQLQNSVMRGFGLLEGGTKLTVGLTSTPREGLRDILAPEEAMEVSDEIGELIAELDKLQGVEAESSEKGSVIRIEGGILFESGVASINPDAFMVLKKVGELINKVSIPVRIEGHTDNVPISTAKYPSNWELSTARAVSVVKQLIRIGNVSPMRLSAVGYGESKPLEPNDTREGRAKNRRVEILMPGQGGK